MSKVKEYTMGELCEFYNTCDTDYRPVVMAKITDILASESQIYNKESRDRKLVKRRTIRRLNSQKYGR